MTDDGIKGIVWKRKVIRASLLPPEVRPAGFGDAKHAWVDIETDDGAGRGDHLGDCTGQDSGAAGHVEDLIAGSNRGCGHESWRPLLHEGRHQTAIVGLCRQDRIGWNRLGHATCLPVWDLAWETTGGADCF